MTTTIIQPKDQILEAAKKVVETTKPDEKTALYIKAFVEGAKSDAAKDYWFKEYKKRAMQKLTA